MGTKWTQEIPWTATPPTAAGMYYYIENPTGEDKERDPGVMQVRRVEYASGKVDYEAYRSGGVWKSVLHLVFDEAVWGGPLPKPAKYVATLPESGEKEGDV